MRFFIRSLSLLLTIPALSLGSGIYNPQCGSKNCIQNQNTLQSGSTFYVSSGTVDQQLTVNGNVISNTIPAFQVSNSTFNVLPNGSVVIGSTQAIAGETFTITANTGTYPASNSLVHAVGPNGSSASFIFDTFGQGVFGTNASSFRFRKADNTAQTPQAIQINDTIGQFSWDGYDGTSYSALQNLIYGVASENWTSTAHGTGIHIATTKNKTTGLFVDKLTINGDGNTMVGWQSALGLSNVQFTVMSSTQNVYEMAVGTGSASGQFNSHVLVSTSGHFITNNPTPPTISACGATPNGSVVGDDNTGTITVGGGVTTSCTLTFALPWGIAPTCTVSDNSTVVTLDISAISATAFTASTSASLGGGKIYYLCRCSGASCR